MGGNMGGATGKSAINLLRYVRQRRNLSAERCQAVFLIHALRLVGDGHFHQSWASQGLSQTAAATLFGVTQPRVSDLTRGKIDRFSIDTLIKMLSLAGVKVSVEVWAKQQVA